MVVTENLNRYLKGIHQSLSMYGMISITTIQSYKTDIPRIHFQPSHKASVNRSNFKLEKYTRESAILSI